MYIKPHNNCNYDQYLLIDKLNTHAKNCNCNICQNFRNLFKKQKTKQIINQGETTCRSL